MDRWASCQPSMPRVSGVALPHCCRVLPQDVQMQQEELGTDALGAGDRWPALRHTLCSAAECPRGAGSGASGWPAHPCSLEPAPPLVQLHFAHPLPSAPRNHLLKTTLSQTLLWGKRKLRHTLRLPGIRGVLKKKLGLTLPSRGPRRREKMSPGGVCLAQPCLTLHSCQLASRRPPPLNLRNHGAPATSTTLQGSFQTRGQLPHSSA